MFSDRKLVIDCLRMDCEIEANRRWDGLMVYLYDVARARILF